MKKHPSKQEIKLATDAVIFTVRDGELMVLLIQMKKKPFEGEWAIPGGLIDDREKTIEAARRILAEQTGVSDAYLEQLMTFDEPKRDPFGRVVSVAYFALMNSEGIELKTTSKYADVRWWPVKKLPKLAYDHKDIMKAAVQRLRYKLEYTNVVWSLLPKTFPLSRLRDTYEIILDRPIDKRNFLKKILSLDMVEPTGKKSKGGAHRPAELYRFKQRKLKIIDLI